MLDLSHDILNQQNQGTARSVPDPSSPRGDWGLGTRLDYTLSSAYFLRFGDFCAYDNNDDFTPCACMQGKYDD